MRVVGLLVAVLAAACDEPAEERRPAAPAVAVDTTLRLQHELLASIDRELVEVDAALASEIAIYTRATSDHEHAGAKARIAELRRRRAQLVANRGTVRLSITSLGEPVPADARAEPVVPVVPPPSTKSAGTSSTQVELPEEIELPPTRAKLDPCDEVSCVLSNYGDACCAKFDKRKPGARGTQPDGLDRTMISAGVAAVKTAIQACNDGSTRGTVRVAVKVSPDGSISSLTLKESPTPALGGCVVRAIQRAKFARTQRGGSFSYPFVF